MDSGEVEDMMQRDVEGNGGERWHEGRHRGGESRSRDRDGLDRGELRKAGEWESGVG
jgi:hypothetical protein